MRRNYQYTPVREEKRVQPTSDVDGIETNGSDSNENLVLAYFGDRCFFENNLSFLEM